MSKITTTTLPLFEKRLKKRGWKITGYITGNKFVVLASKDINGTIIEKEFSNYDITNRRLDDEYIEYEELQKQPKKKEYEEWGKM